jgi:hypothetical protein
MCRAVAREAGLRGTVGRAQIPDTSASAAETLKQIQRVDAGMLLLTKGAPPTPPKAPGVRAGGRELIG